MAEPQVLEAELKTTLAAVINQKKRKVEKEGSNEIRKEISCDGADRRNRW